MRCMLRQGQRLRTPDQRLNRYPVDGTAFGFDRICIPAVQREAHRQFARRDELRDEDVALAHLRLEPCKPLKEFPATLLTHRADHAGHPVEVRGLERKPALPYWRSKSLHRRGQLLSFDPVGIVAGHPEVRAITEPAAMGGNSPCREIHEVRAVEPRNDLLAREGFHFRRIGLYHIHRAMICARFGRARCSTFSLNARQSWTLIPYFFS